MLGAAHFWSCWLYEGWRWTAIYFMRSTDEWNKEYEYYIGWCWNDTMRLSCWKVKRDKYKNGNYEVGAAYIEKILKFCRMSSYIGLFIL